MQFLGFGDGHDGAIANGQWSSSRYALVSTVAAGSTTIPTGLSVQVGDVVMLHQTVGSTNIGVWELVKVGATGAGSFTSQTATINTYTSDATHLAQAVLVQQCTGGTFGGTATPYSWVEASGGGILAYMVSSTLTITGSLNANGTDGPTATGNGQVNQGFPRIWSAGFFGGRGFLDQQSNGEAENGAAGNRLGGATGTNFYGLGGGGGAKVSSGCSGGSGGGGAHATAGSNGTNGGGGAFGYGSTVTNYDVAALSTMVFGGGGGGGANDNNGGEVTGMGGGGGGIILLIVRNLVCTAGSIISNGANGGATAGGGEYSAGGGGAGGSILVKGINIAIGTNRLTTSAGSGGSGKGGNGGVGRIRIEACTLAGTSSPTLSAVTGGYSYCGSVASIME